MTTDIRYALSLPSMCEQQSGPITPKHNPRISARIGAEIEQLTRELHGLALPEAKFAEAAIARWMEANGDTETYLKILRLASLYRMAARYSEESVDYEIS